MEFLKKREIKKEDVNEIIFGYSVIKNSWNIR
jgi:hypothetical protein